MDNLFKIKLDAKPKTKFYGKECEMSLSGFPIPTKGDCIDFTKHECKILFGVESDNEILYTTVTSRTYVFAGRVSMELTAVIDSE